ncbi:hypothetical protein [Anaeromassilibacillus senegalensis]|uniref:hypothetical protein n=1 Tax=Anaeromassilibacillus senegalensis TaxID=1673717 RepID=UPI0006815798|nr:hypothetical protein [Anaeromassilibacillus senegalensis]
MAIIDELVTDRTEGDIERWRLLHGKSFSAMTAAERTEWIAGMKGAYNAVDLNRVGQAMQYIAGRLHGYGYAVEVAPKTDWVVTDIPSKDQLDRYAHDIAALRQAVAVYASTPGAPADMEKLTYQEANDIEKILVDLDEIITKIAAAWYYSGDFYAGEV